MTDIEILQCARRGKLVQTGDGVHGWYQNLDSTKLVDIEDIKSSFSKGFLHYRVSRYDERYAAFIDLTPEGYEFLLTEAEKKFEEIQNSAAYLRN